MLIKDNSSLPVRGNKTHHVKLIDMQNINLLFMQQLTHHCPHGRAVIASEYKRVTCRKAPDQKTHIVHPRAYDWYCRNATANLAQFLNIMRFLGASHKSTVHHIVVGSQVPQYLECLQLGARIDGIDCNLN